MSIYRTETPRNAFTLVELLVVMAIIALLVGVLLPAIGAVRTQAKKTQAQAQFTALDTGLEAYRAEANLGGTYPPSASDNPDNPHLIANPASHLSPQDENTVIAGAHLLFHTMLGADMLGTPGFNDFDRDGLWWNDTSNRDGSDGAYELHATTAQPLHARYGGAGYVSDKMKTQARTLGELQDSGRMVAWDPAVENTATRNQFLFVDPWDQPVLYYQANRAAQFIVTPGPNGEPGIYRQEDNAIITGSSGGELDSPGVDFGAAPCPHGFRHRIGQVVESPPLPITLDANGVNTILTNDAYHHTFAAYILDPSSRVRNEPVRKETYLLISAGPDATYGTEDDSTNWTRELR